MKKLVIAVLSVWICLFSSMALTTARAECIPSAANNYCADYDPNEKPNNNGGLSTDPKIITAADLDKIMTESIRVAQERQNKISQSLKRTAQESIYKQRGLTMDFLNKPVELFKLTCTDGKGGAGNKLTPTFDFTKNIWEAFCADPGNISVGGAAKCMFQSFLQQQFQGVIQALDKFKVPSFCEAFTTFANNQLNQCIKIRFDLPKGQFPGFPAFNQCLFGNVGLNVNGNGVTVSASGPMVDVLSTHGFSYSAVGPNSPTGFGGSEDQLLGDNGASGLMKADNWKNAAAQLQALKDTSTMTAQCANLDPALVQVMKEYPPKSMLVTPNLPVLGEKVLELGGTEDGIIAVPYIVFNSESNTNEIFLKAGADFKYTGKDKKEHTIPAVGTWAAKSAYTYLASCYGFDPDLESTACANSAKDASGNYVSESFGQMCAQQVDKQFCCDPDKTDCAASGLLFTDSLCATAVKPGEACPKWAHLAGQGMICEKSCTQAAPGAAPVCVSPVCCNPNLNDCQAIGVKICEKYIPPKQCLTATPEQLKALDPAYSSLPVRVKANMMIDGRPCCTTEWCNICPQDLIVAASGKPPGPFVYIKESELSNVPPRCKGGKINPDEKNAPMITTLRPVPDKVFDNTVEACSLINGESGEAWTPQQVFKIFIACPQMQSSTGTVLDKIGNWATNSLNGCPDGAEVKPFLFDVLPNGNCSTLTSATKYPTPITKIPTVEGADPIGLCSALPLCPAAIPPAEDPLSVGGSNGVLDGLKNKKGLAGIFEILNGSGATAGTFQEVLRGKVITAPDLGGMTIPVGGSTGGGITTPGNGGQVISPYETGTCRDTLTGGLGPCTGGGRELMIVPGSKTVTPNPAVLEAPVTGGGEPACSASDRAIGLC